MSLQSLGSLRLSPTVVFRHDLPKEVNEAVETIAALARAKYPTSKALSSLPSPMVPEFTLAGIDSKHPSAVVLNKYFKTETTRLSNQPEIDMANLLQHVRKLNSAPFIETDIALDTISKALAPLLNPTVDFPYIGVKETERKHVPDFKDYKTAHKKLTENTGEAYVKYDFIKRQVTYDEPLKEIANLFAKVVAQNLHNKNKMQAFLMSLVNDTLLVSTVDGRVTQSASRITPSVAHLYELMNKSLQALNLSPIPKLFPALKNEPVTEALQILDTKSSTKAKTLEDVLFGIALGVTVCDKLVAALLDKPIDPMPLIEKTLKAKGFTLKEFNARIDELKNKGLLVSKEPINQAAAFLTEKGVFTAPPLHQHVQPSRLFPNGEINPMFKASRNTNGKIQVSADLLALLTSDDFKSNEYQLNYVEKEDGQILVFPNLWSNTEDPLDQNNLLSHDSVALAAKAAGDLVINPQGEAIIITTRSAHFCSKQSSQAKILAKASFPAILFKEMNWANNSDYEKSPKVLTEEEFDALNAKIMAKLAQQASV
jgi:hypothetical protein